MWGVDITYIRLRCGWMYLFAVLDWFSRFVVAWALDLTLEIGFVLDGMRSALATATPTVCNSDQGSHFTSPQYIALFEGTPVQISMDGKERALDNIYGGKLYKEFVPALIPHEWFEAEQKRCTTSDPVRHQMR